MNLTSATMKVILLTGSTDGIGLEAAKKLVAHGHQVLLHGRNPVKLQAIQAEISRLAPSSSASPVETYQADLSNLTQVEQMAKEIASKHNKLDVLINNAGIFKSSDSRTENGHLDLRFAVNTVAPYLLSRRLLPLIPKRGRVVNLSSAAQAPVDLGCMVGAKGSQQLSESEAYAQSKLAITMWTNAMAKTHPDKTIVSVNPASLIGTKMVKEGFGIEGKDLSIGADIIYESAVSKSFERASGKYFDNDSGAFRPPHPDALNDKKNEALQNALDQLLMDLGHNTNVDYNEL